MDLGVGLEGWIGGLVAAAVTLAFSAWWDTRQKQRQRLDEAVSSLAAASDAVWYQIKIEEADGPADMGPFWNLMKSFVRATMLLEGRPRWIPRKIQRSRRLALANRLNLLWKGLSVLEDEDVETRSKIAVKISSACLVWLSEPGTFRPERLEHGLAENAVATEGG